MGPAIMLADEFCAADPRADHAELTERGVDVDAEMMGGDGTARSCSSSATTTAIT
jgi:predicted polyphosphate/ATP-dependent NAD kinase